MRDLWQMEPTKNKNVLTNKIMSDPNFRSAATGGGGHEFDHKCVIFYLKKYDFSITNHIYHPLWAYSRSKYTGLHMLQNGQNHDFGQKINFR